MNKVLVLGDSHSAVFDNSLWKNKAIYFSWNTVVVHGATLSGLNNPNSQTREFDKFFNALKNFKYDAVVTLLGEVDCGFVIWYYAQRDDINVYKAAEKAIENYKNLLIEASAKAKTFVISAPLPTIGGNETHGNVAQERSKIKSTQEERTKLTLYFNKKIHEFCLSNNIEFVDLDSVSMGENGLISNTLINQNKSDHHYNNNRGYISILEMNLLPKIMKSFNIKKYSFPNLNRETIDILRDTAIANEDNNVTVAYELMLLAGQLRPEGCFIRRKLIEYQKILVSRGP